MDPVTLAVAKSYADSVGGPTELFLPLGSATPSQGTPTYENFGGIVNPVLGWRMDSAANEALGFPIGHIPWATFNCHLLWVPLDALGGNVVIGAEALEVDSDLSTRTVIKASGGLTVAAPTTALGLTETEMFTGAVTPANEYAYWYVRRDAGAGGDTAGECAFLGVKLTKGS